MERSKLNFHISISSSSTVCVNETHFTSIMLRHLISITSNTYKLIIKDSLSLLIWNLFFIKTPTIHLTT